MHPAHHQHMGEPRRPVCCVERPGQRAAVPQHHGRQHPAGRLRYPLAEGGAQPLLEPGRPGAEPSALAQPGQLGNTLSLQNDAVRVEVQRIAVAGRFQRKAAPHPLAHRCFGQADHLHPEAFRLAVRLLHPEHRVHDAGVIAGGNALHLGGKADFPVGIGGLHPRGPLPGATHNGKAQQCPQQQADNNPSLLFAVQSPQPAQQQKSRKRQQSLHLRQKSAHQLRPQRSHAENAERPTHLQFRPRQMGAV